MSKSVLALLLASAMIFMLGCSVPRTKPATVIDRSGGASEPAPPGYYRVKKGDTLLRIALDHGQSYKDLVQWNNLSNPNQIEVGDLIMIKAPAGSKVAAKSIEKKAPVDTGKSDVTKADTKADDNKPEVVAEPGIRLSWPAKGKVTQEFSESNKGINIAGKLGEPVTAAAPTSPALSSWPCAALRCCLVRSPPLPCLPFYPTPWLWGPMTACPSRRPRLSSPWTLPRRHSRCIQRRYVCGGACRVHVGQVEGDSLTLRGALGWLAGGTWHAPTWHALT